MKRLGVVPLPPGRDASPSQVYPQHLIFTGTHLYIWVERGTLRVKCLAQEHNTMSLARAWTTSSLRLPQEVRYWQGKTSNNWCPIQGEQQRSLHAAQTGLCSGSTDRNDANGINYMNFQWLILGFQNMYPCSTLSQFWDDTWKVNRAFILLHVKLLIGAFLGNMV